MSGPGPSARRPRSPRAHGRRRDAFDGFGGGGGGGGESGAWNGRDEANSYAGGRDGRRPSGQAMHARDEYGRGEPALRGRSRDWADPRAPPERGEHDSRHDYGRERSRYRDPAPYDDDARRNGSGDRRHPPESERGFRRQPRWDSGREQQQTFRTERERGFREDPGREFRRESGREFRREPDREFRREPERGLWTEPQRARDVPRGREENFAYRRRSPSPIWGRSPTPPRSLEDRLAVGLSRKKRQEREDKRSKRSKRSGSGHAHESPENRKGSVERSGAEERTASDVDKGDVHESERERTGSTSARRPEDDRVSAEKSLTVGNEANIVGAVGRKGEEGGTRTDGRPLTARDGESEDDEEEVEGLGPSLPVTASAPGRGVDYGKALMPGEANAMAAFIQDGKRIPRRGEIGLSSDQISKFEDQGYVMSGSRNRRMEAVRIRKENQVYTAEELAALSQFSHEEKQAREKRILNEFRAYVASKLGEEAVPAPSTEGPPSPNPGGAAGAP